MILRRHRRRHHTLSYAVLSFLAFAMVTPLVVGSRLDRLAFSGSTALAAARDSFSLGAALPLIESAGILLERGTVSVYKTQSASTRSGEALLALLASGNARLVLDNSSLVFTSSADVAATPPPIDAASPLIATLLGSHFESLRINHGNIGIPFANGHSAYLSDVNADISLRRKGVISAKGTFVFNRRTLSFDATISLGDRKSAQRLPISATVNGELLQASLDGRITLGAGIQISARAPRFETPNLRELALWLGYHWPAGAGFERFKAEGNLDLADTILSLQQATLTLDGNEATGSMFVNFDRRQPAVDATLALRKLDFAPYLYPTGRQAAPPTVGWPERLQQVSAAAVPVLGAIEADVRISADRVVMGPIGLGRGAATITAKRGRLIADLAEIEFDRGGKSSLQFTMDATRDVPTYTLRGKASQVDVGQLLPMPPSGIPALSGPGEIVADVTGSGSSPDAVLGALWGRVAVSMPQGTQIGVDLAALMAMSQGKVVTNGWRAAARVATSLDDLTLRFKIANGLWSVDTARARSGNAVFLATGTVYPPTRSVDVAVSRTNGLAASATDGATLPAAASQSVLVRGPWAVPQIVPVLRGDRAAEPLMDAVPTPAPGLGDKIFRPPPGRG